MLELDELLGALAEAEPAQTAVTSVRQPVGLRRALRLAVAMGMAPTVNEATNRAVQAQVAAFAARAALDAHYRAHPDGRPSLSETALALAELDHSTLRDEPDLIAAAAHDIVEVRPDADADDVLLWAASMRQYGVGAATRVQPRASA